MNYYPATLTLTEIEEVPHEGEESSAEAQWFASEGLPAYNHRSNTPYSAAAPSHLSRPTSPDHLEYRADHPIHRYRSRSPPYQHHPLIHRPIHSYLSIPDYSYRSPPIPAIGLHPIPAIASDDTVTTIRATHLITTIPSRLSYLSSRDSSAPSSCNVPPELAISRYSCLFHEVCVEKLDDEIAWLVHVNAHMNAVAGRISETYWPKSWHCTAYSCRSVTLQHESGNELWKMMISHIANYLTEQDHLISAQKADTAYLKVYSALGLADARHKVSLQNKNELEWYRHLAELEGSGEAQNHTPPPTVSSPTHYIDHHDLPFESRLTITDGFRNLDVEEASYSNSRGSMPKVITTSGLWGWSLPDQYAECEGLGQPDLANIMIIIDHEEDKFSAVTFRDFLDEYLICDPNFRHQKYRSCNFLEDFLKFLNELCKCINLQCSESLNNDFIISFDYWAPLIGVRFQGSACKECFSVLTTSTSESAAIVGPLVSTNLIALIDRAIEVLSPATKGETISVVLRGAFHNSGSFKPHKLYLDRPGYLIGATRERFQKEGQTYCWKGMFDGANIVSSPGLSGLLFGSESIEPESSSTVKTTQPDTPLNAFSSILGEQEGSASKSSIKGLHIALGNLVKLAAVDDIIVYDGGIVLMGYNTVLIPLNPLPGQHTKVMRWHFIHKAGKQVTGDIVEGISGRLILKRFEDIPQVAVVGWSSNAEVLLGSEETRYQLLNTTESNIKFATKRSKVQYCGELSAKFHTAFFSPSAKVTATRKSLPVIAARSSEGNHQTILDQVLSAPLILYDTEVEQGWVVPGPNFMLACLQHYLSQKAYENTVAYRLESQNSLATAFPSQEGAFSSPACEIFATPEEALGPDIIFKRINGQEGVTSHSAVSTLWKRIVEAERLSSDPETHLPLSSDSALKGVEFVHVAANGRLVLKQMPVSGSMRAWSPLAQHLPVIFCSGIGRLIRPSGNLEQLQTLCTNASTNPRGVLHGMMKDLFCTYGMRETSLTNVWTVADSYEWALSQNVFTECLRCCPYSHQIGSSTCWDDERLQEIKYITLNISLRRSKSVMRSGSGTKPPSSEEGVMGNTSTGNTICETVAPRISCAAAVRFGYPTKKGRPVAVKPSVDVFECMHLTSPGQKRKSTTISVLSHSLEVSIERR